MVITIKREDKDLIYSVSDNGCGIPSEDIPNLFQRFSQGTSKKRSTGCALARMEEVALVTAPGACISPAKTLCSFFISLDGRRANIHLGQRTIE